jgi:hypothetical protein
VKLTEGKTSFTAAQSNHYGIGKFNVGKNQESAGEASNREELNGMYKLWAWNISD